MNQRRSMIPYILSCFSVCPFPLRPSVRPSVHMQQIWSPFTYCNEIWYREVLPKFSVFFNSLYNWASVMDTLRKLHAFPFANRQYIAEHLQDKGNFGKRIWKKKRNRSFMNNLFLYKIYGF